MSTSRAPLLEVAKDAIRVLAAHNLGHEIDIPYCREVIAKAERSGMSGDRRADIVERMAETLESILFEDSGKSDDARLADRVRARSALAAYRESINDRVA